MATEKELIELEIAAIYLAKSKGRAATAAISIGGDEKRFLSPLDLDKYLASLQQRLAIINGQVSFRTYAKNGGRG